ncbi:MAG: polyprenol monophosphomannose synthase [Chthoniobacterales bacterium]
MPVDLLHARVSVVVPTLNEVDNVEPLVRQIMLAAPATLEIVFVDDDSRDGTQERIQSLGKEFPVRLIARAEPTLGLAGAVIAGAREAEGEIVVVMDADLSHPPAEIPRLVKPLIDQRADMVIGSRYVRGGTTPGWPLLRKIMSRVAAGVAYPLTGVHDSMCGFFSIRRPLLLQLAPKATGFKIAFETIVHGGRDLRVLEVPIAFRDRTRGKSKMSFGVAFLFSMRWLAAATRVLLGRRSLLPAASPARAPARARQKE